MRGSVAFPGLDGSSWRRTLGKGWGSALRSIGWLQNCLRRCVHLALSHPEITFSGGDAGKSCPWRRIELLDEVCGNASPMDKNETGSKSRRVSDAVSIVRNHRGAKPMESLLALVDPKKERRTGMHKAPAHLWAGASRLSKNLLSKGKQHLKS